MSDFLTTLKGYGTKQEWLGNHTFSLNEVGAIWYLEKGSLNIFAIEKKEGRAEGPRTLLATLSAPAPLFPFITASEASHEIVAITEYEAVLWKGSLHPLEPILERNPFYLHRWVNALSHFYDHEIITESAVYIEAEEKKAVKKQETLSLKREVHHEDKSKIRWLKIQEGEMHFLGYPNLQLFQGPFPLTYNAWLKSAQDSICEAEWHTPQWKRGLALFHQTLFHYLLAHKEREEKEASLRAQERFKNEENFIHESLQEMVDILTPAVPIRESPHLAVRPLFNACREIGRHLKVTFIFPDDLPEHMELPLLIARVAEKSDLRFRQVRLTGSWWKKGSVPILAFLKEEMRPVALLPKRGGRYLCIDAEGGQKELDEAKAQEMLKMGYVFYPTFPASLKTAPQILSFYLKHHKKELLPLFFYSLVAAIISLFPPFATEKLINNVIPEANYTLLWQILLGLVMAAVSSALFLFFRSLTVVRLESTISNLVPPAIWDRILKLPVSFFRRHTTGNLTMRVISSEMMRELLSGSATRALFTGIFSLFYLAAMALYAPALTIIVLLLILLSFFINLIGAAFYARLIKKYYELEGELTSFIYQAVSAVGKLRCAGAEKSAFSKWARYFSQFKRADLRAQNVKNIFTVINYVLPFILYMAIFTFAAKQRGLSIGAYLAFNTAFASFYLAMISLSNTVLLLTPIWPLWERTKVILQEPLEEQLQSESPGELRGDIHVDEVCFQYEDSEHEILHNITLKAHPKEFIGIVGPSGSGKSTLIRLLLGFERPTSGAIYFDDKDLAKLAIHDFRKQVGVVLQEEGIIAGSIYENLTCGGFYKPEEIQKSLDISGFAEDVASFPMGLHTYLNPGGTTLSGGQKQRLLIARALLPNPKIIIFDEATSALDNKNQEKVNDSVDRLDVTRIVIAHRLSTIRHADRIYVMDKGSFVQSGTYEELAASPGLFASMLKRQML